MIRFWPECLAEATAIALYGRGVRHVAEYAPNIAGISCGKKARFFGAEGKKRSSSCVFRELEGESKPPLSFNPPFSFSPSLSRSLHPSPSLVTLSLPPNQPTNSGRVDATKELDDFSLTASVTDATAKDIDNAPHLRDALITARTKKDGTNLMIGYDAGQRGALAGLTTATELAGKAVDLGATWFQNGNHVRGEARVQIDSTQSLWATKTLNDDNDVGNATVVNLAERKAFVIEPFNIPVSTAAVKYSIEREGYTVEPAYDLNTKGTFLWMKFFSPPLFSFFAFEVFSFKVSFLLSSSHSLSLPPLSLQSKNRTPFPISPQKTLKITGAFLSVTKAHDKFTFRPQYAFADEVALLEVAYDDGGEAGRPLVRAYAKAPAGPKGFGPVQLGVIADKAWEF